MANESMWGKFVNNHVVMRRLNLEELAVGPLSFSFERNWREKIKFALRVGERRLEKKKSLGG